jgi:hypothetical protein
MMNITIKKYQELNEISQIETDENEKASLLIQTMLDMDGNQVKDLPEWRYKKICKNINEVFNKFTEDMQVVKPKKYVRIGLRLYRFNYDLAKLPMNTGRYVETATFVSDITNNLHKLLATINPILPFQYHSPCLAGGCHPETDPCTKIEGLFLKVVKVNLSPAETAAAPGKRVY